MITGSTLLSISDIDCVCVLSNFSLLISYFVYGISVVSISISVVVSSIVAGNYKSNEAMKFIENISSIITAIMVIASILGSSLIKLMNSVILV